MNKNERIHSISTQNIDLTQLDLEGRILDIGGGGEGVIGQLIGREVIAIDSRIEELEEANGDNLKIVMDASELKFLDNTFDGATSFFTFMYIKKRDHKRAFEEAYRVLKDEKYFIIWDVTIPEYKGGVKDIFLVPLEIKLKNKIIKTTYGISWNQAKQDINYYKELGEAVGFEIISSEKMNEVYCITFKKIGSR